MEDGRSAFIRIFEDSTLAPSRGPHAEGAEAAFTPRFDRYFDNKENIDPLRRFTSGEDGAPDDKGDDDEKKPGISGRKSGLKFGLGSCSKKSKSPLPENYPRIPFQDITDILDPDTGLYIGEQVATPASDPQVLNSSGKRKAGAMNSELVVEERQQSGKRQQLRRLASRRDGDLRKFR